TPVPSVSITIVRAPRPAPARCSASAAALPSFSSATGRPNRSVINCRNGTSARGRSEEHTSELQSRFDLVCRLLLEKKKRLTLLEYIEHLTQPMHIVRLV